MNSTYEKSNGVIADKVLIAIGKAIDGTDMNTWPPVIPSQRELAKLGNVSRGALTNVIREQRRSDDPLIASPYPGTLTLTPKGIAWLQYRGYLNKFVRRSDKGFGVTIPKLEIIYPT